VEEEIVKRWWKTKGIHEVSEGEEMEGGNGKRWSEGRRRDGGREGMGRDGVREWEEME
jgi:hypothetical protein